MFKIQLFLIIPLLVIGSCGNRETPAEIDAKIRSSETLTRVDRLCREIPKPEDFVLVRKHIYGNSLKATVAHDFTTKSSFEKSMSFFRMSLSESGWKVRDDSEYEKGNQRIWFGLAESPKTDFTLVCSELF